MKPEHTSGEVIAFKCADGSILLLRNIAASNSPSPTWKTVGYAVSLEEARKFYPELREPAP